MMRRRKLALGASAVAALSAAVSLVPAGAGAQSQRPTQRVIIVLKNQEQRLPATRGKIGARRAAMASIQAPVRRQLSSSGARNVRAYTVLNAISATVSGAEVSRLRANSAVREVVPDQIIHLAPNPALAAAMASAKHAHAAPGTSSGTAGAAACGPNGATQLNPEALQTIHADSDQPGAQTARSLGFDGSGVTVGFIADGLDINNPDFIRADGSHVFVDYKDFSGEGTNTKTGGEEAFGDAGSIASQGTHTYNVAGYGPDAVKTPCNIRVEGVAPGASLVGLSIFGANDAGYNSSFLDAINYAVTVDHVNVLNESLGNNYYPDDQASLDLIKQANDSAVAAGTTVTASSGDAGVTSTIGTPATDPNVIAAGATTTYRVDLQTGYGGAQFPGVTGYLDNDISSLSSGGFTQDGRTIDVVAPGELNWSLCSVNPMYQDCVSYGGQRTPVVPFGGTSESAPLTAGVAALVIQAYAKTHGTNPSPAVVKQIITSTADDIRSPADQQGAGLIDAYKAVQAAESYSAPASSPTPTGDTVLAGSSQLNGVTAPGSSKTFTDTFTNNGADPQTLSFTGRVLGTYSTIKSQTVTLSDSSSPKTTDWAGVQANYQPITFTVPAGKDRLNTSIAFQAASLTDLRARVRMTLVDPSGALAGYSVPQGNGNYGNLQITNPKAGTWTAYVWSRVSSAGGTTGPVVFGASTANYQPVSVTPSQATLAPGQSTPVSVTVTTPSTPGDYSGSIVATSDRGPSFGQTTTVPVTLRSLIPQGRQSFTQTLTGGNGRSLITGQTFYYQLAVPQGRPELNANITLADNPNNPFTAFLVSPSGEARAVSSNAMIDHNGNVTNEMGAQVHVLNPSPGSWTLIVGYVPAVSGTALEEPFTVSTSETKVPASAPGLPNSTSRRLAAGKPVTFNVRVTNTGPQPESYFIDPRLAGSTSLNLTALNSPDTQVPLTVNQNLPQFLMPTETTALNAAASTTGSEPIQFDSQGPVGDPDIGSSVGTTALGSFRSDRIEQGQWDIAPDVTGAYGPTGAANEPVHTSMAVTTAPFDSAVSSPTGDLWLASTDPSALDSLSPTIVGPGQTRTIPVTFTPKGASGSTVSGTLFVDDESSVLFGDLYSLNGDEVAALPYSYTIK